MRRGPRLRAVLVRLGRLLLVLVAVTLFLALLTSLLPGDPVDAIASYATDEQKADLRAELGLDDPVHVRYGRWVADVLSGDLGDYYGVSGGRPVADRIGDALPVSLQLLAEAQVMALALAIPLGVATGYRAGTRFDRVASAGAFALLAVPSFALALMLAYYVGVELGWLPVSGYVAPEDGLANHLRYMTLPALSLALGQIAVYMRLLRSDMITTLQQDFIAVADAKGLPIRRVLWRHAFRPSSLTLLTTAGLNVGTLIGGAVVVEVVFSLPGMGTLLFEAIQARQYVALQSLVAVIAVGYILLNAVIDSLVTAVDPRLRHARA